VNREILTRLLERERCEIETALEGALPAAEDWPSQLHAAMRYAVFAGGKRIRPILARWVCAAAGGDPAEILGAVCGLEMIHTYSLVHDDLPAMDNDVLRRGQPTVWAAYDEATAVLVGDALLTEGLLTLSRFPEGAKWAPQRAQVTQTVALAVSSRGMVGGQMADISASSQVPVSDIDAAGEALERIHRHKTGCLLQAAVETGAILARVDEHTRIRWAEFGAMLGLAFQVADDILDATASAAELGKSPGKDAAAGKLTFATLYGIDQARRKLAALEQALVEQAEALEHGSEQLRALVQYVTRRKR